MNSSEGVIGVLASSFRALAAAALLVASPVFAWGPNGHQTIGVIADRLLAGSNAAAQVQAILGGLSLRDAAVWADCAKGVDPGDGFAYTGPGRHAECAVFETAPLVAGMADFVRRNHSQCARRPGEQSCHKQYHYTDVAIQRDRYTFGSVGTRADDIVAVVAAATHVLKGEPAPAPFDIRTPREALLLLAHHVGDIHQPLHVGAIYLGANGERVDPDAGGFDRATETRGANQIVSVDAEPKTKKTANLHHTWDAIPSAYTAAHVDAAWLAQARAVPATPGSVFHWPAAWAGDTLAQARAAFADLRFDRRQGAHWSATLPLSYDMHMNTIKKRQLTRAGARLAQLLMAIWP